MEAFDASRALAMKLLLGMLELAWWHVKVNGRNDVLPLGVAWVL